MRLNVEVGDRPCCSRGDPSQQWGPITAVGTRHSSEKRSACQLLVMDLDVLVGDRQGSSGFSFRATISAIFLPCKIKFTNANILVGLFFRIFGGGKGFSLNFKLEFDASPPVDDG